MSRQQKAGEHPVSMILFANLYEAYHTLPGSDSALPKASRLVFRTLDEGPRVVGAPIIRSVLTPPSRVSRPQKILW